MKKIITLLLVLVVIFAAIMPKQVAYADPVSLTAAQVGAAALSVGSSLGIGWNVTGVGAGFMGNWIGTEVQRYDNGESLIEAVSQSIYVDLAGRLALGQAGYNAICEFIEWLREKYTIDMSIIGTNNRVFDPQNIADSLNGWRPWPGGTVNRSGYFIQGWSNTENPPGRAPVNGANYNYSGMHIDYLSQYATAYYEYSNKTTGAELTSPEQKTYSQMGLSSIQKQEFSYPEEYALPTVIDPGQEWVGSIGEHSVPDTNIGDLLGGALEDVEGGNLDVGGEIVEAPDIPEPVPTFAPGTGELADVINQLLEMGYTLDQIKEIVGTLDGTLEGIGEGITDITEALEVPTTSEVPAFKFDLTTLFPFCIPFDIYRFVTMFNAAPVAPHVQIPFNIPAVGLQYTFDLDFSSFDGVASVLRSVELIAFCVGLAILTSKVIRW